MQFIGQQLRHELKFYIHVHEYIALRQRLTAYLKMDKYSLDEEGYGISSLYFDGILNQALYDKNDGIFHREKYRIRIYNGSTDVISVECKIKYGEYISKQRALISMEEYQSILAGDYTCLAKKEDPLLKKFYRRLMYEGFKPAVIVDYCREAYQYDLGNVRITFDKRLAAGIGSIDLFDPALVYEEVLQPTMTILEVKFDDYLPDVVRQILQLDAHNRSAISKYVLCREVAIKHFKE